VRKVLSRFQVRRSILCGIVTAAAIGTFGCRPVGPDYAKPPAPTPQAFKEPVPAGWKEGEPRDDVIRGKWWEIFNDPQLNALEEQVPANLNIVQAEAQFRAARFPPLRQACRPPTATRRSI
jgi:outer membrane protein TolC